MIEKCPFEGCDLGSVHGHGTDQRYLPKRFPHVTSTAQSTTGKWVAYCRCEWVGGAHDEQTPARKEGDAHLEEHNAP